MEEPVLTPKAGLTAAVQTAMGDPDVNSVIIINFCFSSYLNDVIG